MSWVTEFASAFGPDFDVCRCGHARWKHLDYTVDEPAPSRCYDNPLYSRPCDCAGFRPKLQRLK